MELDIYQLIRFMQIFNRGVIMQQVKNILYSTLFIIGLGLFLLGASLIVIPKNNLDVFGMDNLSANGILGEKENSIDVLVIGDSESYSAITPMQLWNDHGITSYVCGTSGQLLTESKYFLLQAFEKQKPKLVILETDAIYRNFSLATALTNIFENKLPIFKYHNRWKSLKVIDFGGDVEYTWRDDYKGYSYSTVVAKADDSNYMTYSDQIQKINKINENYVLDMAKFCQENGVTFMLLSTPSTINWNYPRHNGISQFVNEHQIPYLDLNLPQTSPGIDWNQDTRDQGDHLNHYGAKKVTSYLGDYLKNNFQLGDHRNDENYQSWNEAYQRYLQSTSH